MKLRLLDNTSTGLVLFFAWRLAFGSAIGDWPSAMKAYFHLFRPLKVFTHSPSKKFYLRGAKIGKQHLSYFHVLSTATYESNER